MQAGNYLVIATYLWESAFLLTTYCPVRVKNLSQALPKPQMVRVKIDYLSTSFCSMSTHIFQPRFLPAHDFAIENTGELQLRTYPTLPMYALILQANRYGLLPAR